MAEIPKRDMRRGKAIALTAPDSNAANTGLHLVGQGHAFFGQALPQISLPQGMGIFTFLVLSPAPGRQHVRAIYLVIIQNDGNPAA